MPIMNYPEIGKHLAKYRKDLGDNPDKLLKDMPDGQRTVVMLAAVLRELEGISIEFSDIRHLLAKQITNRNDEQGAVQDGFLYWTKTARGARELEGLDQSTLSKKARRKLRESGAVLTTDVTRASLKRVHYCGDVVADEILRWMEKA